ncbi:MAG: phenylalanine--tRNA ligase subunit beta [Deltaproteobacteria bacterium]|nr:phenylalanine--tRNA ligase subunit beta [Deltaproteobacteria bacterium]
MLVSLNWLKEFVDIDIEPEDVAQVLTMGGIEIESITHVGLELRSCLTGKIEKLTAHPNSEKLKLAHVNLGEESQTVVCGAPNTKVGLVVAFAPAGSDLPSGVKVGRVAIKGVDSPGMLCSEKELGLGEDASGLLVFGEDTPIGVPLRRAFSDVEDVILEVSVTPNRGDCLSIIGVAREIAALTGKTVKLPTVDLEESGGDVNNELAVEVPDFDLCPRYVARMIDNVEVRVSPFPVRLRLFRGGVRPISNIVDATNYVLMECGQPLHAFDYFSLGGQKIVVRRCAPGEVFQTLDKMERRLPDQSLMIRDAEKSVALAGIMGGLNSEILNSTNRVVIESACFERFGVRRTAKALGMSTEASFRFERGVDPEGCVWAANRVASFIQNWAGGNILKGIIDVYPEPIIRRAVKLRTAKSNTTLGLDISSKEVKSYLQRLGIALKDHGGTDGELECVAPSWRWDLEREIDYIEEVARIHGFQNIPATMPVCSVEPDHTKREYNLVNRVRDLMNASGFTEIITMSFISGNANDPFRKDFDTEVDFALMNPLTEDFSVMRRSLLPGLMGALKRNLNFKNENLRLYEIGRTFVPVFGAETPLEHLKLTGAACGSRYPNIWHFNRGEIDILGKVEVRPEVDFFDIKGALENILAGLGIEDIQYVLSERPFLHPGKSSDVLIKGERIGFIGELSPEKTREIGLSKKVQIFDVFLEPLFVQSSKDRVFNPLPRYPYIERDLSVIVETNCSEDKIKLLISRLGHDIITSVILFDLYRGESIPEGHKSMAFRIRYQSEDRTLTDAEVQEVHSQVITALIEELGISVRE